MEKLLNIRNEINQFIQFDKEPFWICTERFENLLAECPHHGLKQWHICHVVYECLDQQTRVMLKSMCQGGFLFKNPTTAWKFIEDLDEKTMQRETVRDVILSSKITSAKGGMYVMSYLSHIEFRFATLEN